MSTTQQYANVMDKVLTTAIDSRSAKFREMLKTINPPKTVAEVIKLSDYLDGTLVPWRRKQNIFTLTKDKADCLTCTCCGTVNRFGRLDRVLLHLMSKKHHQKCKEKDDTVAKERSKELLNDHCKAAASILLLFCILYFVNFVFIFILLARLYFILYFVFILLAGAEEIVKRVKDYAALYCANKSLPFSAAEMALDCVS